MVFSHRSPHTPRSTPVFFPVFATGWFWPTRRIPVGSTRVPEQPCPQGTVGTGDPGCHKRAAPSLRVRGGIPFRADGDKQATVPETWGCGGRGSPPRAGTACLGARSGLWLCISSLSPDYSHFPPRSLIVSPSGSCPDSNREKKSPLIRR